MWNTSKHLLSTNEGKLVATFQKSSSKSCSWQAAVPTGTTSVCPNHYFHWKKSPSKEAASSLNASVQHLVSSDPLLAMINAGGWAWKAASANPKWIPACFQHIYNLPPALFNCWQAPLQRGEGPRHNKNIMAVHVLLRSKMSLLVSQPEVSNLFMYNY